MYFSFPPIRKVRLDPDYGESIRRKCINTDDAEHSGIITKTNHSVRVSNPFTSEGIKHGLSDNRCNSKPIIKACTRFSKSRLVSSCQPQASLLSKRDHVICPAYDYR
jgi:hypothetical protein